MPVTDSTGEAKRPPTGPADYANHLRARASSGSFAVDVENQERHSNDSLPRMGGSNACSRSSARLAVEDDFLAIDHRDANLHAGSSYSGPADRGSGRSGRLTPMTRRLRFRERTPGFRTRPAAWRNGPIAPAGRESPNPP